MSNRPPAKQVVFKADLGRIIDVNTGIVMAVVSPTEGFAKSVASRVAKAAVQTLNAEERGKWVAKQQKRGEVQ